MIIQALKKASKEDRGILQENYGKEDKIAVSVVKEIYNKLDLSTTFKSYEENSFKEICDLIESQREDFPKQLFIFLAQKIYKRKK